jgi:hypothetical protein
MTWHDFWHAGGPWKPIAVTVIYGVDSAFPVTIVLYGCTEPDCLERRTERFDGDWKLEHFEQVNEASKTGGNDNAVQSGTDTAGKT